MRELTAGFVAAADEVYRLQTDSDPECRFFRKAVRGSEEPSRGTMQGTYVFAASGQLLARRNSNDPQAIRATLEAGLAKWRDLDAARDTLPDAAVFRPRRRWEDSYPNGGLVLERWARDLPASGGPGAPRAARFNHDAVWFNRAEARQWLPATLEAGARHALPRTLVDRLACLVLVDNVRGQTLPYDPSEARASSITTEVTAVDGSRVTLSIDGLTHAKALGAWLGGENYWKPARELPHAIETSIHGSATFDTERQAFVRFDLVAVGRRSGRTAMNGRARDAVSGPIGFVLRLAPPSWRVAPTFINVYGADWVKAPR